MKLILVASDKEILRIQIRTALSHPKFSIMEARHEQDCLNLATIAHPDLLILDMDLPRMSSMEVFEALEQNSDTANIPIILVTTREQEEDKEQPYASQTFTHVVKSSSMSTAIEQEKDEKDPHASGSGGYILKHFDQGELLKKVKELTGSII